MSVDRDDLIDRFWRHAPTRVAELTDQWLAVESGERDRLPALRRALHTFKGEAHMLGLPEAGVLLERCERVVDAVRASGAEPKLAGDALLGGFEGLGLLASSVGSEEVLDLGEVHAALDFVLTALGSAVDAHAHGPTASAAPDEPAASAAGAAKERHEEEHEKDEPRASTPDERALDVGRVQPLLHELTRLHAEHTLLLPELAEAERQLRALLTEIRPDVSAELLRERIVKTLGYGTEIERRLSALRETWSANEFATRLALEQLQDLAHVASLVSTDELVAHVHRVARGTAKSVGKEVDVDVRGDALVDAAVERRLRPCLIHLVRNAVDHGIEPAALRRERGKPAKGIVRVTLTQDEGTVRAVVEDDGGGIDFDGLRKKLAPGATDAELLDRIFEHGVSVRDVATEISGRGVGLDVVARELATIAGVVNVESTAGLGARFVLTVPVTLRADVVVPLVVRGETFAVPARAVSSVRRAEKLESTARGPHLRLGEEEGWLVPIYSLSAILSGRGAVREGDTAIVLRHRTGPFALCLDAVHNPRPVTFQRTEELAFRSRIVQGVAVLADGGTMQLLDVETLHSRAVVDGRIARDTAAGRTEKHVLVVEDAPVARELLVGLLRSLGLRVSEAVDGRDGLARALADRPDLVLTDIEMPFLDGLALIARLRQEPSTAGIPIIVLTTRADPETEARAKALGVRAFLSKQRFVEDRLREVVEAALER